MVKKHALDMNIGRVVEVAVNNGQIFKGKLRWVDGHMNVILEVGDKERGKKFVLIRGSHVALINDIVFSEDFNLEGGF